MLINRSTALAFWIVVLAAPTAALAHAQLQQAVPAVGGTIAASPAELRLTYSEGVEPRFSTVTLAGEAGGAIPLGKLAVDPADPAVVVVKIGRTLPAGTYTVTWHVVSVDTHKTQGRFDFTIRP